MSDRSGNHSGDRSGDLSGMVNVAGKPDVHRTATASGTIRLKVPTIEAIGAGLVKKGDVLCAARMAAILAVKKTPELILMCHTIPIAGVKVGFAMEPDRVKAVVTVTSVGKTGVEMEALAGVVAALLNIWDMVKYLEKDEAGGYPDTLLEDIRVVEKRRADIELGR
jgi:cyclic pyranopterin phosphate synthase